MSSVLSNLLDTPVYIVSTNTQRDGCRNKMIYLYNNTINSCDYWGDEKCQWVFHAAGPPDEFYLVSTYTQRNTNQMLYLQDADTTHSAVKPYTQDATGRWKFIADGKDGKGWIVSSSTSRRPNHMIYLYAENSLHSFAYWQDPACKWQIIPARQPIVKDVQYQLDNALKGAAVPFTIIEREFRNTTSVQQSQTFEYQYAEEKSSSFEMTHGWSLSLSTSIKAGVPFLAEQTINIEASVSGSYTSSQTSTKTNTITITAPVVVDPKTRVVMKLVGKRQTLDIPWEGTLYWGEDRSSTKISGTWHGVDVLYVNTDTAEYPA